MDQRVIEFDDLVEALERIEMLTATGTGLDPDTTMQIHLMAGIGRATHDEHAWHIRSTPSGCGPIGETE